MATPAPFVPDAPPRRRTLRRVVLILLAGALLGLGGWGYLWYRGEQDLRTALAEADRLDPGWRLADLEAARVPVPDDDNSARQVEAAAVLLVPPLLPAPASSEAGLEDELRELEPATRLSDRQAPWLRAALAKAAPALPVARRLAAMPHGRYAVAWSPDGIGTLMPHLEQVYRVADVLRLDALLRAHDGDADGALESCRALLNTGRSVGDEPTAVSQLTRLSCQRSAVRALERALAQGEPSDAALAAVQRLLEEEEKAPLQLVALRGERALVDRFLETVAAGKFDRSRWGMRSQTGSDAVDNLLDRGKARATRAAYLRYHTELVEISKLPPEQQAGRLDRPGLAPPRGVPRLLEGLRGDGDIRKLVRRFRTDAGRLRCAAAAVAAERYRRAHGHWPDDLDALVPAYLAAVPTDPFGGQPLRLRRLLTGVVVEGRRPAEPDVRFTLWDPDRRRQPAP